MGQKEQSLSRDQAKQLYQDLQKNMEVLKSRNGRMPAASQSKISDDAAREIAKEISAALKKDTSSPSSRAAIQAPQQPMPRRSENRPVEADDWATAIPSSRKAKDRGPMAAITFIAACAAVKLAFSVLEYGGVLKVETAQASYEVRPAVHSQLPAQQYSPQELQILTSLDNRRTELDNRSRALGEKEKEIEKRDAEFQTRIAELRELSGKLRTDREKTEKKQSAQLTQLANVYNSMNPQEAAQLLDQLDITTAMSLFEHMSEKRIGQILPVMAPERALTLTKMLSGKK